MIRKQKSNTFIGILFIVAFLITLFFIGGARAGGIGQWNAGKEARKLLEVPLLLRSGTTNRKLTN